MSLRKQQAVSCVALIDLTLTMAAMMLFGDLRLLSPVVVERRVVDGERGRLVMLATARLVAPWSIQRCLVELVFFLDEFRCVDHALHRVLAGAASYLRHSLGAL